VVECFVAIIRRFDPVENFTFRASDGSEEPAVLIKSETDVPSRGIIIFGDGSKALHRSKADHF